MIKLLIIESRLSHSIFELLAGETVIIGNSDSLPHDQFLIEESIKLKNRSKAKIIETPEISAVSKDVLIEANKPRQEDGREWITHKCPKAREGAGETARGPP